MAKFKKGDRVRCVVPDRYNGKYFSVGDIGVVEEVYPHDSGIFSLKGRYIMETNRWELATPSPIPDTVTIGGVEYVRKPEPEHVWAWGQWARVKYGGKKGLIVFVTGGKSGFLVPVTYRTRIGEEIVGGFYPSMLEYLGTATIPE